MPRSKPSPKAKVAKSISGDQQPASRQGDRFQERFELDMVAALADQLETAINRLTPATLTAEAIEQVQVGQGVYALYRNGELVYVGKADNLRGRLEDHSRKIGGRRNIHIAQMTFVALYVSPNWTALAPENSLIRQFQKRGFCEWNGNGFGPHDPGRNRELTDKDPDGFDSQFPIIEDLPVPEIKAGHYSALHLLVRLKKSLPYLLRYEVEEVEGKKGHYSKGHSVYRDTTVEVPRNAMPADELLKLVASAVGWQATVFPSHMILYNERHVYKYGRIL